MRYDANKDHVKAYVKRWQQENVEHVRAYRRAYNAGRRREVRDGHLRRKFGISVDDYAAMLAMQGGGCAICGRPEGRASLHVDHDHETGEVRGLLCFPCNGGLGMLTEDDERLARAFDYVTSGGFVRSGVPDLLVLARGRAAALGRDGVGESGH